MPAGWCASQAAFQAKLAPVDRRLWRAVTLAAVVHCVTIAFVYALQAPVSVWSASTWLQVAVLFAGPAIIAFTANATLGASYVTSVLSLDRDKRGAVVLAARVTQVLVGSAGMSAWFDFGSVACAVALAVVPAAVQLAVASTSYVAAWTLATALVVILAHVGVQGALVCVCAHACLSPSPPLMLQI